jgi:hypothetical protein
MAHWLVTWAGPKEPPSTEARIAGIFSGRVSPRAVAAHIEQLYVDSKGSLSERLAYAKNKNKWPYRAYFDTLKGAAWLGRIYCGHNPYLYARIVDDLKVIRTESGEEVITWKEQARPEV